MRESHSRPHLHPKWSNKPAKKENQKNDKPLHIAFLDVTKAYDKAWLNTIIYATHKNGLTRKNWRIVKELNSNISDRIRIKHGDTRTINIKDNIRQGGVLSVIEYANIMDEISKRMLDITDDIATRYHIKFGQKKAKY